MIYSPEMNKTNRQKLPLPTVVSNASKYPVFTIRQGRIARESEISIYAKVKFNICQNNDKKEE